jgi:hypothetical protein
VDHPKLSSGPSARHGHACTIGRRDKASVSNGFFVCGGRARQRGEKARVIFDEVWWCNLSNPENAVWEMLLTPSNDPAFLPRFHNTICPMLQTDGFGFMIFGGNVSTNLLRLPVDGWIFETKDGSAHWKSLEVTGLIDEVGQMKPYGRVHSTAVLMVQERTPPVVLMFGGESNRPYMYHADVWSFPYPQPGL